VVWFVGQLKEESLGDGGVFLEGMTLAVGEGVANAMIHGCGLREKTEVEVDCWREIVEVGGEMTLYCAVTITDPGPGFNPLILPAPDLFSEHGRGVFFMRQLMDEVRYDFHHPGTALTLKKRLP
jgi:anti-sigma regulatory factor (Ser/Thr protein kinase)